MQSDISIRGGSFDQILILLNGVKINDPQTGHHNFNLPVDLSDIERIEILEGAGAREFGPNAFSGAINIITKQSSKNNIKLRFTEGEHNLHSSSISGTIKNGKLSQQISLNKKLSEGYIKNTDFDEFNTFYQADYLIKENTKLNFQAGYNNKAFGANSFYTPAYPDQYEQTKTYFSSTKLTTGEKIKISPSIYWRRHQDRFELFRYEPASWYKNHNYHLTDVMGAKANFNFKSKFGKTAIGFDINQERIYSNVLGESLNDTLSVPGEKDGFFTKHSVRQNASIFINQNKQIKKFSLSGGLLANWNSVFGVSYNPGVDLGYYISDNLKAFTSYNQAIRLPTFTDLYYVGPTNIGNSNLKPEFAETIEFGLKYSSKKYIASAAVFHREGTNIIDWVRKSDTLKWESHNITTLNTNGFEISNKFIFDKNSYLKSVRIDYSFLTITKQSEDFISKYSLDYLKHKASISLNHKIYKNLSAFWKISYQDREGTYTNFDTGLETDYAPFTLVDFRIMYTKKLYKLYIEASNLTNEEYIDIANIEMPGRWIKGGVIINLDL